MILIRRDKMRQYIPAAVGATAFIIAWSSVGGLETGSLGFWHGVIMTLGADVIMLGAALFLERRARASRRRNPDKTTLDYALAGIKRRERRKDA
jgi:predicted phage tail protein